MKELIGFGGVLLIAACLVGPLAFYVLEDPSVAQALTSFVDNLSRIEWQPLSVQVTVAVLLIAVLLLVWLAIMLGCSRLARVVAEYAAAFGAKRRRSL